MTRWRANPPECEVTDLGSGNGYPGLYIILGPTEMAVEATANQLMGKLEKTHLLKLGPATQRGGGGYGCSLHYVRKDSPHANSSWIGGAGMNLPAPKKSKAVPKPPPAMPASVAVHMAGRKSTLARVDAALRPAQPSVARPAAATAPARKTAAATPRKVAAKPRKTTGKPPEPRVRKAEARPAAKARSATPKRGPARRMSKAAEMAAKWAARRDKGRGR